MDVDELRLQQVNLRDKIFEAIMEFQKNTGECPDVDVDVIVVESIGKPPDRFPNVRVTTTIR